MNDSRFNDLFQLTSIISLVFQISGTALIAVMSYVVSSAVRRRLMLYWAVGWSTYTLALVSVLFASRVGPFAPALYFGYFFFEYAAVLFIYAGCLYTSTDQSPPRRVWMVLAPAFLLAAWLAVGLAPSSFFWAFVVHTTVLGVSWAVCLIALRPALRSREAGPGVRIVAVGLVLLSLDYLHHLPTALYNNAHNLTLSPYYYTIMSLIDGMFEFVLGFGTVVVIVDKVRTDLEKANWQLKLSHDRTEDALHTDELTGAFSRYSFASTFGDVKDRRLLHGCIVVVDLDGLKGVNDTFGHAGGDAAIRAVADGLRTLVRHEDRVYRWGGDEFVIVLADITIELARRRMAGLDEAVNQCMAPAHRNIGTVSVSSGVAEYGDRISISDAITVADAAMYAAKTGRKSAS